MGGTFDPVHLGHLTMAASAYEQGGVDEVWFMPSSSPPHKEASGVADAEDRLEMVRLAIGGHSAFRLCMLEIERGGTSYTIDTARQLIRLYPEHQFLWIIGADMIAYLPNWTSIDELGKLIQFIGVRRPGYEQPLAGLPGPYAAMVQMIEAPLMDISSTEIRERLQAGEAVDHLLPEPVAAYIRRKGLYGARTID